ncbi:MAG: hypothetical protein AB1797_12600 [bacterium]
MPAKSEAQEKIRCKCEDIRDKIVDTILNYLPPEMVEHLGNSKREILLALRSVIDHAIAKTDQVVEKAKEAKAKEAQK